MEWFSDTATRRIEDHWISIRGFYSYDFILPQPLEPSDTMSWKRNSLGRLGDITEEENVDRTKEQALLSYQEQQTEALYEEEFENDESKESFTENPEERTEIKAIYDQNSDGQITSQETSKVKINLPLEISEGKLERRKTIYDLDSYVTSSISMHQYYEADEESADLLDKPLGPRYSQSMVIQT